MFVAMGDMHLKQRIWKSRSRIENDTLFSLFQIVNYCESNDLPLLLLGDFFDTANPSSYEVSFAQQQLSRLKEVYWIDGNHDYAEPSWAGVLNVTNINDELCEIAGLPVYGLGHKPIVSIQERLESLPAGLPSDTMLAMHQLLDLSCRMDGMWNLKAEWVPERFSRVLMGDYHVTGTWGNSNTSFHYTGSSAPLSISESPNKSFSLVSSTSISLIPLVTRPLLHYTVNSYEDLESLLMDSELLEAMQPIHNTFGFPLEIDLAPIVVVKFDPALDHVKSRVEQHCANLAHLWFKPLLGAVKDVDLTVSTTGSVDRLALAMKLVDGDISPATVDCLKALIQVNTTQEAADAIHILRQACLADYEELISI